MQMSVSRSRSDPEAPRTLFPLVARGHFEIRQASKRLVEHLLVVGLPLGAEVRVDRFAHYRGERFVLAFATRVESLPLFGCQIYLRASRSHIQHNIQQGVDAPQLYGQRLRGRRMATG